jgi:hypothetical protein
MKLWIILSILIGFCYCDSYGPWKIDFAAAEPSSYNHLIGGGAWNDGTFGLDISDKIQKGAYQCGDIVTVLLKVCNIGPFSPKPLSIAETNFNFGIDASASPIDGYGVGFTSIDKVVINYGLVPNGDNGTKTSPGAAALGYDSGMWDNQNSQVILLNQFYTAPPLSGVNSRLIGIAQASLIEPGEIIIIRIDLKICCEPFAPPHTLLNIKLDPCSKDNYKKCKPIELKFEVLSTPNCCDGNACTSNTFQYGLNCSCTTVWKNCSDGNNCTLDLCNPYTGQCVYPPNPCDDFNICTLNLCNSTNGTCIYPPVNCTDNNLCTVNETCDPRYGCISSPLCVPTNSCVIASCNPLNGTCTETPVVCFDGNPCTNDTCDPLRGCVYTPTCNDSLVCTIDSCQNGVCAFTPRICNDGVPCTLDSCVEPTGCTFLPMNTSCNDGIACTADFCDPVRGCIFYDICRTGNPCNDFRCDFGSQQCVPVPTCPPDNIACTVDTCIPTSNTTFSCSYVPNPALCPPIQPGFCLIPMCTPQQGCTAVFVNDPTLCQPPGITCQTATCTPTGQCQYMNLCPQGFVCDTTINGCVVM